MALDDFGLTLPDKESKSMINYYLVIVSEHGLIQFGPFASTQERDDFTCGLWFNLPVRQPGYQSNRRIPFHKDTQSLYYTAVNKETGRLGNFKNVTVGDLARGKNFPRGTK